MTAAPSTANGLPAPDATPSAVQLPAVLTHREAVAVVARLAQAADAARAGGSGALVVDASPLQRFDSAALAVLLEGRRLAQAANSGWQLHGASERLLSLVRLYGLDGLLTPDGVQASPAAA